MKKMEIATQTNLMEETYTLLFQWINNADFEKSRDKYEGQYQEDIANFNKKFNLITEMYRYVIDNIQADKERIEYYFKERNPHSATLAAMALLLDMRNRSGEVVSYEERIKSMTLADRISIYAMYINDEEAANTPKDELSTESDLVAFLESSAFDIETKWEAIKIFNNQEKYYNEIAGIIKEASDLLNNKYGTVINELLKDFYDYWSICSENIDIIDTMSNKLKISWKVSEAGAVLAPLIFSPFGVSIAIDEIESRQKDLIRIGIMLDKRFELTDRKLKKEDVVEIGKLLCDKSKVDILEFVSIKPCYGKEIANALGLSTATISYHVNALLKISFLQAEVISNKIYYSIDKDKISSYMEEIKSFFINLNKE